MKKKKILVVEDDALIAKDIEKILLGLGYSARAVIATGKGVAPKIIKENPDLILMDIMIQDKVKGIEIARKVRRLEDIPVVYLTAHSEKSILRKAKISEPYGYLLKPVSEKDLEIAVEMALYRHDIERRYKKKMNKILEESESRYRQLVENIDEGIVMQNKKGVITYANQKFLDMIGYTEEEVIGKSLTKFLAGGLLKKQRVKQASLGDDVKKHTEISWKRKDGDPVFTILSPKPVYNEKGQHKGTVALLTDITDRRIVEKELYHSRENLRKLSQHIQTVREKESKRMAREIHDELGQQLTALKMDLSWMSRRIQPEAEEADKFLKKIDSMSALVEKTIHTVQKISAQLRPGLLDDLGLWPAIEWLAQEFKHQTTIPCRLQLLCDLANLDPDCSTAIFRISQEALTNVARHSGATRVTIGLNEKNGFLVFKIRDNGKGIEADDIFAPSSLGLMGMMERARVFGGELRIDGKPDKGTTLTVTFPVERVFKT